MAQRKKRGAQCSSCGYHFTIATGGAGPDFVCGHCLTDPANGPKRRAYQRKLDARARGLDGLVGALSIAHSNPPPVVLEPDGSAEAEMAGGYTLVTQQRPVLPGGWLLVDAALWMLDADDRAADAVYAKTLKLKLPDEWPDAEVWKRVHSQAFQELADMAAVIQSQTLLRL